MKKNLLKDRFEIFSIISNKGHVITDINDIQNKIHGFMSLYNIHSYYDRQTKQVSVLDGNGISMYEFLESFKTEDKITFEQVSDMCIRYLNENHHPHHTIIITHTGAELLEGVKSTGDILKYLKD